MLTRLIPMLPVKDVSASIAFYQKLGFQVEMHSAEWGWAKLKCGDSQLMVDQSINAQPSLPRQAVVYLYPADVVAYHRQVRQNGIEAPELDRTFYGMNEFRISDPDGNSLWIGQPVAPE